MIWFTSDLHINHENIIKYCNRPFTSVQEMNNELVSRWNAKVSPMDTVYVVGDVMLGDPQSAKPTITSLNGNKILILGNHDRSPRTMMDLGFSSAHRRLDITLIDGKRALLSHKPLPAPVLSEYHLQIHGHRHSGPAVSQKKINVCVDLWGYEPVSEEEICDIIVDDDYQSDSHVSIHSESDYITVSARVKIEEFEGLIDHMNDLKFKIWK